MNSKLTRWCDGFLEAGWLVALIVTPLFFNIHSERVFEPDKLTLLRSIATLMAAVWLVKFVDQQEWRDLSWLKWGSDNSIWRKPLILPVFVVVVVYLISTVFSVAPRTSWFGSYQRLQGTYSTLAYIVIFATIVSTVQRRSQIDRIITMIVVTSIPVAFYALLQRFELDPLPWGGNTSERVAGHMGNSIFVAAYLIMTVPITATRIIDSFYNILTDEELAYADVVRSSIYILALAVQGYAIYATQSRGPLIGLAIGLFAFVLILLVALRNAAAQTHGSTLSNLKWPLVYVVACLAALFISDAAYPSLGGARSFYLFAGLIGIVALSIFILAAARIGWAWLWSVWLAFVVAFSAIMLTFSAADQFRETTRELPVVGALQDTFEAWAELPTMNRLGELLNNNNTGTARVRILIWEGAVDLVLPHEPLNFSAEREDRWNFLRPLIGYGPEAMYVAYNRFYPPLLATIEARNASPDRSHNETFDALIITGAVGFVAWQVLYLSAFYYGFSSIGVVRDKRDRNLLIGFWVGSALVVTAIIMSSLGAQFLGVSIPFGSMIGLVGYLVYYALSASRSRATTVANSYDTLTLVMAGLLASLIAFYVEIHFGIAIAATRTYAFAIMGLIVVIGVIKADDGQATEAAPVETLSRRRTKGRRSTTPSKSGMAVVWGGMLLLSIMFATLVYDFINFTPMPGEIEGWRSAEDLPSSFDIFYRSLFFNPRQDFIDSPYLFGVLILSWLFGVLLLFSETIKSGTLKVRPTSPFNDSKWSQIAAGLLVATALAVMSGLFQDADPAKVNSLRIGRMLTILWIVIAGSAAGGLLVMRSHPLVRPFAGAVATLGILIALPTMLVGSGFNGVLLLVLSLAALYVLWDSGWQETFGALALLGGGSIGIGMLYGLVHSSLIRASFIAPSGVNGQPLEGLTRRVVEAERVGQYLTIFYAFVILLLLVAGAAYAWRWISAEKQGGSITAYASLLVLFVASLFWIDYASLNLIQADMTYKRGRPYDQQAGSLMRNINTLQGEEQQQALAAAIDTWDSAVAVYERTVEMAPNEDFYYLWLGRAYLEESQVNLAEQAELLDTAEDRLKRAQAINPLNTDHTANLARLNVRWAQLVDESQRQTHIDAAKGYYEDALALSPQNSIIRNEYAGLLLSLDRDCDAAIDVFLESTDVDPYYYQTYVRLTETYLNCANQDGETDVTYLEIALETLDTMMDNVPQRRVAISQERASNFRLQIAQRFIEIGDLDRAMALAEQVEAESPEFQPQVDSIKAQIEAAGGSQ